MTKDKIRIAVLDGFTLNPGDLDWSPLQALGELSLYDTTDEASLLHRAQGCRILLVNKVPISREAMSALPDLACIVVTATGYNNIDVAAARALGITVCNAVGYSTEAVVQQVFAMLLALTNRVESHHQSVLAGDWSAQAHFCYTLGQIEEIAGKTMGIFGYGSIGKRVGELARAFGMEVLAYRRHPADDGVRYVSLQELFAESDVVSLHAPLNEASLDIVNLALLRSMKPSAFLINTARGGLIRENDLRLALDSGMIAGAALDVLSIEPPSPNHPLLGARNCLITPHMAWASLQARKRLMAISIRNVAAFLEGTPINRVG
jgi:glycerate dehydrogenase